MYELYKSMLEDACKADERDLFRRVMKEITILFQEQMDMPEEYDEEVKALLKAQMLTPEEYNDLYEFGQRCMVENSWFPEDWIPPELVDELVAKSESGTLSSEELQEWFEAELKKRTDPVEEERCQNPERIYATGEISEGSLAENCLLFHNPSYRHHLHFPESDQPQTPSLLPTSANRFPDILRHIEADLPKVAPERYANFSLTIADQKSFPFAGHTVWHYCGHLSLTIDGVQVSQFFVTYEVEKYAKKKLSSGEDVWMSTFFMIVDQTPDQKQSSQISEETSGIMFEKICVKLRGF